MQSAWKATALAAAMLGHLACSAAPTGDHGDAGGSAGSTGATTTSTLSTTSTTIRGPTSCDLPDLTGKAYTGYVSLGKDFSGQPSNQYYFSGLFDMTPPPAPACAGTVMGSCCYNPGGSVNLVTGVSAGTLTLDLGGETISTIALGSVPEYDDTSSSNAKLSWEAGDALQVSASGATVGPFSVTVFAPAFLPNTVLAGISMVSTSSDLSIPWPPSGQPCDKVEITISDDFQTGDASIVCDAPDTAGSITVPAAFLAQLRSTTPMLEPTIVFRRYEEVGVLAGDAAVTVRANHFATSELLFQP